MRKDSDKSLEIFNKEWLIGKSNLIGIEIGSYAGESAEIFLKSNAFKVFYCIDPWEMHYDPTDDAGESEDLFIAEKLFDERFKDNPIVKKIKMKSSEAFNIFKDDSIDFIYIDGNHQYEFVKQDLINYVPKIKKGGIISGHDRQQWLGVDKALDEYFHKKPIKDYPDTTWIYIKE
jgi:hypothetical protein